jgi:hypothetical protein
MTRPTLTDGRKSMTPEKLQHLEKMRLAKKQKAAERQAIDESSAKQEYLQEISPSAAEDLEETGRDVDEPETEEPIERPPRVPARKKTVAPRKKSVDPYAEAFDGLTSEDIRLVKEMARDRAAERKKAKWNERKRELVQDVIEALYGEDGGEVGASSNHLSIFDD